MTDRGKPVEAETAFVALNPAVKTMTCERDHEELAPRNDD
jgi:hypothetical protein